MRRRFLSCLALWMTANVTGCTCAPPVPEQLVSDFDFTTGALSFSNFDDTDVAGRLSSESMARMFGAAAVCVDAKAAPCELTPFAQRFVEDVNRTLHSGHSEGMAVVALLFHLQKLDPAAFGATTPAQLTADNPRLLQEIAYWGATQKVPAVLTGDKSYQAKDVMPFLAQVLQPGQHEGWRLAIAMRTELGFQGGHALVPFGFFQGTREGQYFVRVYDSSFPAAEQRLEIDTKANTWHYEGSPDPTDPRPYDGNAENGNRLYFSPVTPRLGVLPSPFADSAAALSVSSDGVNVLLSDEAGSQVGLQEGRVFENGGKVVPGFSACLCQAPQQIVNVTLSRDGGSGGKQTIAITDVGAYNADGGGVVNVTGPGLSASISGVKTRDAGQTVTVDPTGKKLTYTASGNDTTTITTVVNQPDGGATTVSVTVNGTSSDVVIDTSDPTNVTVKVDGSNKDTKVGVTVSAGTAADGGVASSTTTFSSTGNDAQVSVNTATQETHTNTNTTITFCENGHLDGQYEPDVDCGLYCANLTTPPTQQKLCVNGKRCTGNSDCQSGLCVAKTCHAVDCKDTLKDQDETDVDCGGTRCGPCAEGLACLANRDCQAGRCLGGFCHAAVTHTLHVEGLGEGASFDLGPTSVDGVTQAAYEIKGRKGGTFDWVFGAYQYDLGRNQGPGHGLGNPNCSRVDNPTNDPTLVARPGNGDGGLPTLRCVMPGTNLYLTVDAVGCYGSQAFNVTLDGDAGTFLQQPDWAAAFINHTPVTTGVGNFRQSWAVSVGPRSDPYDWAWDAGTTAQQTCVMTGAATSGTFESAASANVSAKCSCVNIRGCDLDSDCASNDCECGVNSGHCAFQGLCGAGKATFTTPTADGLAASGTFTVPPKCTKVLVEAWGAAGGSGAGTQFPFPSPTNEGGAGGFVGGVVPSAAGDVFTVWVGAGGTVATSATGSGGLGSYLGSPVSGGHGEGTPGQAHSGGGGGLTSLKQTGSATMSFVVPAGSGAGQMTPGEPGGGANAGSSTGKAGADGVTGTVSGGGGAGQPGGKGGGAQQAGSGGDPGAFGTLPTGLSSAVGATLRPPNDSRPDYVDVCSKAGSYPAGSGGLSMGGSGCVIVRCVAR